MATEREKELCGLFIEMGRSDEFIVTFLNSLWKEDMREGNRPGTLAAKTLALLKRASRPGKELKHVVQGLGWGDHLGLGVGHASETADPAPYDHARRIFVRGMLTVMHSIGYGYNVGLGGWRDIDALMHLLGLAATFAEPPLKKVLSPDTASVVARMLNGLIAAYEFYRPTPKHWSQMAEVERELEEKDEDDN